MAHVNRVTNVNAPVTIQNSPGANVGSGSVGHVRQVNVDSVLSPAALTAVGELHGPAVQAALLELAAHLSRHPNRDAAELLTTFTEEAGKPGRKRAVLRAIWEEFKALLPHAPAVATALKTVAAIFAA
ncbi:MAG: hypothetical protein ACKVT1_05930 [Dehalococcoidia bacterium]